MPRPVGVEDHPSDITEENDHDDRLVTVAEAAHRLGLHGSTLRLWARQGRVPVVRMGDAVRFRESTIKRIMAEGVR